MRAGRSLSCSLALALALTRSARVGAEPSGTASLEWVGPDAGSDCLGKEALVTGVEDALGKPVFTQGPSEFVLAVSLARREGFGWRALIQIRDARGATLGERALVSETESCASLNEPLVFAVMLMVDSELAERARARKPEPPKAPAQPGARDTVHSPKRSSLTLDAALLGAFGFLPKPTLGADLGVELVVWQWLALRAHAVALVPRARAAGASAQARFGLYEGGVLVCPGAHSSTLRVAGCAGIEAGLFTQASDGFVDGEAGKGVRPFFGFSAGVRASYRVVGRFSAVASATAVLPQFRERFTYAVEQERRLLFEMGRVCAVVGLGSAFEF